MKYFISFLLTIVVYNCSSNKQTHASKSDKPISDSELFRLVQQQTFQYFCDFAHPDSGIAREGKTSVDVVATGNCRYIYLVTSNLLCEKKI